MAPTGFLGQWGLFSHLTFSIVDRNLYLVPDEISVKGELRDVMQTFAVTDRRYKYLSPNSL